MVFSVPMLNDGPVWSSTLRKKARRKEPMYEHKIWMNVEKNLTEREIREITDYLYISIVNVLADYVCYIDPPFYLKLSHCFFDDALSFFFFFCFVFFRGWGKLDDMKTVSGG